MSSSSVQFTQDLGLATRIPAGWEDSIQSTNPFSPDHFEQYPPSENIESQSDGLLDPTLPESSTQSTNPFPPHVVEEQLALQQLDIDVGPNLDLDLSDVCLPSVISGDSMVRILLHPQCSGLSLSLYGAHESNRVEEESPVATDQRNSVKVVAVSQTTRHIGCTIMLGGVRFCCLYFDPDRDDLVLRNDSSSPISLERLGADKEPPRQIKPTGINAICLGLWGASSKGGRIFNFCVLPRRFWLGSGQLNPSTKRRLEEMPQGVRNMRRRLEAEERRCDVLHESGDAVLSPASSHPLLSLDMDAKICVLGQGDEAYNLTRRAMIAENPSLSVWAAEHSGIPARMVVVKVIKRGYRDIDTIIAAETWLQEIKTHSALPSHAAILPLLECDARFFSIYVAQVEPKSLAHFRRPDGQFTGVHRDLARVLRDISAALDAIHNGRGSGVGMKFAHADLKPANIRRGLVGRHTTCRRNSSSTAAAAHRRTYGLWALFCYGCSDPCPSQIRNHNG